MNSELHMPCERGHGPLARSLARRTHNGCRSRSSQIKSTRIWLDLFFLFFVSESDVTLIIYLTIKPVWAFLVRLFSWRETSLVNIQGKNANARRRFWWRHVIGDSSRLTPTILWHNIEDLKSIASTKTDGIICRWACCHNSREEFFCSFFYSLILFASWGNWCLVYPKTNYYKKKNCHCMVVHLHTICRDLFTQCSEFLVFFVGGWGGDSSSSSVGKGRTSSLSRFQIRRSFLTRSSWLWNGETFFFFWYLSLGKFHMILASWDALAAMGTWGSRVSNVHLRHVASRLLAGAETHTHTHTRARKVILKGRENKSERGGSWERLIKGERDGTHIAPQVQCCISSPGCERIEPLQVNPSRH